MQNAKLPAVLEYSKPSLEAGRTGTNIWACWGRTASTYDQVHPGIVQPTFMRRRDIPNKVNERPGLPSTDRKKILSHLESCILYCVANNGAGSQKSAFLPRRGLFEPDCGAGPAGNARQLRRCHCVLLKIVNSRGVPDAEALADTHTNLGIFLHRCGRLERHTENT
jgi:hypothetical protein